MRGCGGRDPRSPRPRCDPYRRYRREWPCRSHHGGNHAPTPSRACSLAATRERLDKLLQPRFNPRLRAFDTRASRAGSAHQAPMLDPRLYFAPTQSDSRSLLAYSVISTIALGRGRLVFARESFAPGLSRLRQPHLRRSRSRAIPPPPINAGYVRRALTQRLRISQRSSLRVRGRVSCDHLIMNHIR